MGDGSIDFEGVTRFLIDTGYDGWLIVEDESAEAEIDPDGVTTTDGVYLRKRIVPLIARSS